MTDITCNKQEIESFDNKFEIKEILKPKSWCLLMQSIGKRNAEEVVFTVQGVLILKELPPLRERPR